MPRPLLLAVYVALAVLAAVAAFKYIFPILVPFIIALIFSVIMEPLIVFLQRRARMTRGLAVLTAMLFVFGGIAVGLTAVILQLVAELIQLSVSLPALVAEFRLYYKDLFEKATAFYVALPPGVIASVEQNISNLAANLQGLITRAVNSILLFLSLVPGTLTIMVVSLLATYFLARDRHLIVELLRLLPAPWGEKTVAVSREVAAAFVGYMKAQAVLVLMTTVLSVAGLYLIGARYALTMGLLVGFFDMIPVLGPATIYVPWLIWSFARGDSGFGLKITVLYALILVVRQVSETKIVSSNLGLHPLATLLAMYAGLKTLGLAGLILGPLLLIAVQAFIKAGVLLPKVK
ncbi:MAG: sporulation integral membrane protein YtvI [Peptococcaceae bacterium]|nr:sporulation integral membrane protein YtvI [Peptococcaceae bacterium]